MQQWLHGSSMHTWVHCHLCVPKCTIMHHPLHVLHVWSMQGGTPGRHHLRRLHRPPRRRPAPRSQLQPQHQPPASPRPGTLRNRTPPVATVQERAQRGYGGGWGEHYTCGGRCRCVWVAPDARTCTRPPSRLQGGGTHFAQVVLQTFARSGRHRWDGNAHQVHHHQSVQPILKRRPQ